MVGGKTVTVAGQTWEFPSEAQCLQCHTAAAGRTLGLEIGQLNGNFGYPTGRTANQLTTLNAINVLTPALAQTPAQLPVIPDPSAAPRWARGPAPGCIPTAPTATSPAVARNRPWICGSPPRSNATGACDVAPTLGDLGITNPRLIAPGSAARSVVMSRVNRTGANAMPPLARHHDRHRGRSAADGLGERTGELQLRA